MFQFRLKLVCFCTCSEWPQIHFPSFLVFSLLSVGTSSLPDFPSSVPIPFHGMANATSYTLIEHSSPPMTNSLVTCSKYIIFLVSQDISNVGRIAQWLSITWLTCSLRVREGYFSILTSAGHRKSSGLIRMHKLSGKNADYMFCYILFYLFRDHSLRWPWDGPVTLKLFVMTQSCFMASHMV